MRALKRLFLTTLIGLTGLATAQAELKPVDYNFKAVNIPAATAKTAVYIVQMKDNPAIAYTGDIAGYKATKPAKDKKLNPNSSSVKKYVSYLDTKHDNALKAVGADTKIYSYHYALNGFAAVLTPSQVQALRARDDVVQVWRDEIRQPATDTTPDYLGLTGDGGVWDLEGKGEDVIVGIIDTGIWPEHPSFSDQDDFSHATGSSGKRNLAYGPPPAGWSGICQSGERFSQDNCNNKLIGARYYSDGFSANGHSELLVSEYLSPRDSDGHGSHTASTAAGNEGPINTINATPVSGVAPRARIAVYKVCWEPREGDGGCASSDSAAAIDQALADGVDVINFSIGGSSTSFNGADDIMFLFAADGGVFVATSNGNNGPGAQTTGTPAGVPWITAVGATQDNHVFYQGVTVNTPEEVAGLKLGLEGSGPVQLEDTGTITGDVVLVDDQNDDDSNSVNDGCEPVTNDVAGKIALVIRGTCSFATKYNTAADAGAVAIIVYNDGTSADRMDPIVMSAPDTTIPGVMVTFNDGTAMAAAADVNATLDPSNIVSADNRIAGFSSRGPNGGAPDIIKPDVAAPGVDIIAAGGPIPYISISGTSMASPHVAGIFALLKEAHPDWSPAMAKSALMTSARQNLKKTFSDEDADSFDIGAGAIVPAGAFAPGLVYDAGLYDYLAFTCDNNVQLVSDTNCGVLAGWGFPTDGSDLNLASIGIADLLGTQTITRTVTSVSPDDTEFTASVDAPAGIDVVVTPNSFTLNNGESQTFTVEFTVNGAPGGEWAFGALTWDNDSGQSPARSPIAVKPVQFNATPEVNASGIDGSVDIDVQFGYTGDYTAVLSGIEISESATNSISTGFQAYCADYPALTHLRFATFDSDTTPAEADLDLRLFYADDGCEGTNPLVLLGSSGGATSEEVVDVANPAAGGYFFVIDYYSSSTGSIDYTAWIQPVFGDEGNATVSATPGAAVANTSSTVTVDYGGLTGGTRYLGVVQHEDGIGEMSRTIIDIDTQ